MASIDDARMDRLSRCASTARASARWFVTPQRLNCPSADTSAFSRTDRVPNRPSLSRSADRYTTPASQRGVRAARLERHAAQVSAAGRAAQPGQRAEELALPIAHDPGQPDDLPGRRGQRDVVESAGGKVPHGQHRGLRRPGGGCAPAAALAGNSALHGPAHDELEELGVGDVLDCERAPDAPVAQHRDPLAEFAHLGQPVGDVHDGHPAGGHPAQFGEQGRGVIGAQGGGGLVEDQHRRVGGQRLGHLEQMPLGHGQAAHPLAEAGPAADPGQL